MRTRRSLICVPLCVVALATMAGPDAGAGTADSSSIEYTEAELQGVKAQLDQDPDALVPGTTWSVDLELNRVVVSYDDTVTGRRLAGLRSAVRGYGAAVRLQHLPGNLRPMDSRTVGGNAIFGLSGFRCSLGFNTIRSGVYYLITAGHCTETNAHWYDNDNFDYLGYRTNSYYGGMDYGIIRYTNTTIAKYGAVDLYNGTYHDITTYRRPLLNEYVCRSGSSTGVRCGYVRDTCATTTHDDGVTLYCMIKTTACANDGDSGGPLWSGGAALGVLSGSRGSCSAYPEGPSFFMPVWQILEDHGLSIY